MRLHLDWRAGSAWIQKFGPDHQVAAILPSATPGDATPRAVFTYGPIVLEPDEPMRWHEEQSRAGAPARCRVEVAPRRPVSTTAGWQAYEHRVIVSTLTGDVVEVRRCIYFSFLEHAAIATLRCATVAALDSLADEADAIIRSARPEWAGEETPSVHAFWDLDARTAPRGMERARHEATLRAADAALASQADGATQEQAHYARGVALGARGDHEGARRAWEAALAIAPDRTDTLYNLGQARFTLGDLEGALAAFEAAQARAPDDVSVRRKVVQCLYSLGRLDAGLAARTELRAVWAASSDPTVRRIQAYVFHQFDHEGLRVFALETLAQPTPAVDVLLTFQAAILQDGEERALPATVIVETSAPARDAGTPFVLGVTSGSRFRVVDTLAALPPYPELARRAAALLHELATP